MRRFLALAVLLCAGSANAALSARDLDPKLPGHEAVYDSTRNITWLANPVASGIVSWYGAVAFVDTLVVGGYSGWRMAGTADLFSLWNEWQNASMIEFGIDFFTSGDVSADAGMDSRLFSPRAMMSMGYVWDPDRAGEPNDAFVWSFSRHWTDQGAIFASIAAATTWAVHDGELAPIAAQVPEPQAFALMLGGLLAVSHRLLRRAKRRH